MPRGRRFGVPSYGYGTDLSPWRSPVDAQEGVGPESRRGTIRSSKSLSTMSARSGLTRGQNVRAPLAREARREMEVRQPHKSPQERPESEEKEGI